MVCSYCREKSVVHSEAYFCFKCGKDLKNNKKENLLFPTFAAILGGASAWGTIELKSFIPSLSLIYCVTIISLAVYLILRVIVTKNRNGGLKNISDISATSGIFYILSCWVMLILDPPAVNTFNTYINGFLMGSAHISLLIFINLIFIFNFKFFNSRIDNKNIHKTLDTAETIIEMSTPKGLVKHLKKHVNNENE